MGIEARFFRTLIKYIDISLSKYLLVWIILIASGEVFASDQQWLSINCDGAKKDAITELKPPLSKFAKIYCTKYGHILSGTQEYAWLDNETLAPFAIAAQFKNKDVKMSGHDYFFKKILYREMTTDIVEEEIREEGKGSNLVIEITLINQEDDIQKIYLFPSKSRGIDSAVLGKLITKNREKSCSFYIRNIVDNFYDRWDLFM